MNPTYLREQVSQWLVSLWLIIYLTLLDCLRFVLRETTS